MPSKCLFRFSAAAVVLLAASAGQAQTMIVAQGNVGGSEVLSTVDLTTGVMTPYMKIPLPAPGTTRVLSLGTLPDGRLAGTVFNDNGSSNQSPSFMTVNPAADTFSIVPFGTPLDTFYIEGLDYSPRHNAIMVTFTTRGSFGTNRLGLVNTDGTVISTTGAIAGISDFDYVLSSATNDIFIDLNSGSNPRVKQLVNPLPSTTFSAFASPPANQDYSDGAVNPTTADVWFTRPIGGSSQLARLVGNTYVAGPSLLPASTIRGMAFAFLPAKAFVSAPPPVCPNAPVTLTAPPAGTGPFTQKWQYIGGPPPANVTEWTDITNGVNVAPAGTEAPGRFLFNATGAGGATLVVDRATVPNGDPGLPNWSHAGIGQFRFRSIVTGSVGAAFTSPETSFQLVSDLNFDGLVNTSDLTTFLGRFGQPAPLGSEPARADFNADGVVNTADLTFFLGRFGSACP